MNWFIIVCVCITILYSLTVPPPTVSMTALSDQIVGDPLSQECNVITVRGVTSSVDIVWMKDNEMIGNDKFKKSCGYCFTRQQLHWYFTIFISPTRWYWYIYSTCTAKILNDSISQSFEITVITVICITVITNFVERNFNYCFHLYTMYNDIELKCNNIQ